SLIVLDRCRHGSAACCIWLSAMKRICALEVMVKAAGAALWSILERIRRQRDRNAAPPEGDQRAAGICDCTLCAAVIFSTLDSAMESRSYEALAAEYFCP